MAVRIIIIGYLYALLATVRVTDEAKGGGMLEVEEYMYFSMWTCGSGTVVLGVHDSLIKIESTSTSQPLKPEVRKLPVQHATNNPFKTGPFYSPS